MKQILFAACLLTLSAGCGDGPSGSQPKFQGSPNAKLGQVTESNAEGELKASGNLGSKPKQ